MEPTPTTLPPQYLPPLHLPPLHLPPLRRKPFHPPPVPIAAVADAIVQPALAPLPEFDHLGRDPVTAPVLGKRHVFAGEPLGRLPSPFFQLDAVRNHLALVGGPGAQPAAEWPAAEIGVRFFSGDGTDSPGDPNLPLQLRPIEHQGGAGIELQLYSLLTSVVGEEHEAALVRSLEQDHPDRGSAFPGRGGQGHRIRLHDLRLARLGKPALELGDGIGAHVGFVETRASVVATEIGDGHGCRI